MFDTMDDFVFILDGTGHILATNPVVQQRLGYTAEELVGASVLKVHPEDRHQEALEIIQAMLEGRLDYCPIHLMAKDGTMIAVETKVTKGQWGGREVLFGISRDITEREKAASILRESEARHRALISAMPDWVFRNHRDGACLDYHMRDAGTLRLPPDQPLDQLTAAVLPTQQHEALILRALQTGEEQHFEYTLHNHGKAVDLEARMVPSGPDEVTTIVRDVTERKRAEVDRFELALEKERVQLLRQFIERAAHEFRTPLAVISSTAYIMARLDAPQQRLSKSDIVKDHVAQLTHLVDMLLTMSRLESEPLSVQHPVAINQAVESACNEVRAKRKGGVTVNYTLPPTSPIVIGKADDLANAFEQILDNACRFAPDDSSVAVNISCKDGQVWLEITDGGPGISEEHLPYIFDTFWRLDEAHSTPGFGLGLPIARKILERSGGDIRVESEVGKGTTVRITLPEAG
ncbi:MAG: PAS domain S-box protein [Caldilineaceae bacterium]